MFRDRHEAGQKLAVALLDLKLADPVVLALPRGGVPVAAEVARALKAPLDLLLVRKIGAPGNPELAIAAIVDGEPPDIVLNHEIVETYELSNADIQALVSSEWPELERRKLAYSLNRHPISVASRTAILVDDGAATGATMKVAIRALKRREPASIIVALPVASPDAIRDIAEEADKVVCLSEPVRFLALGYHYRHFPQLSDKEVLDALHEAMPSGTEKAIQSTS